MPALVELSIPFFVIAATFVLVGIARTHAAVHGSENTPSVWQWLTGVAELKYLFGVAAKAASFVASYFAASQLRQMAKWLTAIGTLTSGWFAIEATFAEAVAGALGRIEHRGDRKARTKAAKAAGAAAAAAAAAKHANRHAGQVGGSLNKYKAHTTPRVNHLTHAVDVAIPHDITTLRERNKALERAQTKDRTAIGELENGATKTWDWIRTHPLSATTGLFAGAVSIALARLGYGFLRCRSWQKLGRSLTCNDANVLGDLLAAATLAVGAMSLVELCREEQKVIGEAAKIVQGFWEL